MYSLTIYSLQYNIQPRLAIACAGTPMLLILTFHTADIDINTNMCYAL